MNNLITKYCVSTICTVALYLVQIHIHYTQNINSYQTTFPIQPRPRRYCELWPTGNCARRRQPAWDNTPCPVPAIRSRLTKVSHFSDALTISPSSPKSRYNILAPSSAEPFSLSKANCHNCVLAVATVGVVGANPPQSYRKKPRFMCTTN